MDVRVKLKVKATKEIVWAKSDGAFGYYTEDKRYFGRSQVVILDRKVVKNS